MERKSNFEAFRIVCILLIVIMHTFGTGIGQLNTHVGIFVNVIGNIGVTGFILLSGYFGIHLKLKKMIKLDLMVIFWSVISYCILVFGPWQLMSFGRKDFLTCFIPIISHKYWFLSAYFCLCILSPFINEYLEKIDKKRMQMLIVSAGILFLLIPTLVGFDQTGDGGKGIVNMILAYIIGRYIGMYHKDVKVSTGKLTGILLGTVLMNFLFNEVLYVVLHSTANYFARDNSILTMIQAICLLLIFMQSECRKKWVNMLAANVVAVYVLEDSLKMILGALVPYGSHAGEAYYILVVVGISLLVYLLGCVLEAIRKIVFGKAEDFAINKIGNKVVTWKKQ